jgi:hypothetical protein
VLRFAVGINLCRNMTSCSTAQFIAGLVAYSYKITN